MTHLKKSSRVALFRNNFLPYSETFIHDELRFHQRYEATVFARTLRNENKFTGHKIVAIDKISGPREILKSAWYGATCRNSKLESAFKAGKFDIVHAHFGHNGVYAMGFAKRHNVPLVVSLHGRDVTVLVGNDRYKPSWWFYTARRKQLFNQTTFFLAASSELKNLIVSAGCPKEKVLVHYLGVDVGNFTPNPSGRVTNPAEIVMVGRFVEKKGHQYGISAVAQAIELGHNLKLVIIGDGPLKAQYDSQIRGLGIEKHVEFPGSLSHGDVLKRIARSTVVLAPSVVAKNLDRESGLIVAKEAAACGVPTIGTLHGGIPDIIDDGETGFLVPERNASLLSGRLCDLLNDDALRGALGLAARKKMLREYDIQQKVVELEGIYDRAIENYGNRHSEDMKSY